MRLLLRDVTAEQVDSNSSVQCVNQWELDRQEMKDLDALYRQTDATSTPHELAESDDEGDAASMTRSQDLRVDMTGIELDPPPLAFTSLSSLPLFCHGPDHKLTAAQERRTSRLHAAVLPTGAARLAA